MAPSLGRILWAEFAYLPGEGGQPCSLKQPAHWPGLTIQELFLICGSRPRVLTRDSPLPMCPLSPGPLLLLSAGNTLTKQSFLSLSAPGTGRHTAVSSEELPELAPAGEMPPTLTWKPLPHLSRQSGAKMRQEEACVRVAPPDQQGQPAD